MQKDGTNPKHSSLFDIIKKCIKTSLKYNLFEHLLFLILGLFAVWFYEERLFADSGYYFFRVVNEATFRIEHGRYILIFSQILPLLGLTMGLGLKSLLLLYSLGHVLFFYIIFLIARYRYQDKGAGILLLLLQTLGIMSGFFVPMFELYYGAGLLVLFSSILYRSSQWKNHLVLFILAFFILTAHPFAMFLFVFVLALHAISFKTKFITQYLSFFLLITSIIVLKKFTATEYEIAKTAAAMEMFKNGIYDLNYIKSLFHFLKTYYKELLLIISICLAFLIISKNYLKAVIVALGFLITLAVVNVSYYGFEHSRYQEQVYFPLSFIAAYAFVHLSLNFNRKIRLFILSFIAFSIISIRIYGITLESKKFSNRIMEIKYLVQQLGSTDGTKFIVKEDYLTHSPSWSYPLETLIHSACYSKEKMLTICTDTDMNFNNNRSRLLAQQYLFRRWELYDVKTLNQKYFRLDNAVYKEVAQK